MLRHQLIKQRADQWIPQRTGAGTQGAGQRWPQTDRRAGLHLFRVFVTSCADPPEAISLNSNELPDYLAIVHRRRSLLGGTYLTAGLAAVIEVR
jgi:hypothetical protein